MRSLIIGVLAGAALLTSTAGASTSRSCGRLHQGGENHIVASDLTCSIARKIVNQWHAKAVTQSQGPGNKTVGDFRCVSRKTDPEHVKVKCTHKEFKNQWVTFHAGP